MSLYLQKHNHRNVQTITEMIFTSTAHSFQTAGIRPVRLLQPGPDRHPRFKILLVGAAATHRRSLPPGSEEGGRPDADEG